MSTVAEAPPGMDQLTAEWFDKLRKALGKSSWYQKSNVGEDFEKHYAKIQKSFDKLDDYGADISKFLPEYNKIVADAKKAADDKSSSKMKDVDKALEELRAKLKKEIERTSKELDKYPWEKYRAAAVKLKAEHEEKAGTSDAADKFDDEYDRILDDGMQIGGMQPDELKKKHERIKGEFGVLIKSLQTAISTAGEQEKLWKAAQGEAQKALAKFVSCGAPDKVAEFQKRLADADDAALGDHQFAEAKKSCTSIATEINKQISEAEGAQERYKILEPQVADKLAKLEEIAAGTVYAPLDVSYQTAVGYGTSKTPDYAKAVKLLETLDTNVTQKIKEVTQSQAAWTNNADRAQLTKQFAELEKKYKSEGLLGIYFMYMPELKYALGRIESVVTDTGDYDRGLTELKKLKEHVAKTVEKMNADSGNRDFAKGLQKEFDANTKTVEDLLKQLIVKLKDQIPASLQARFDKINLDFNAAANAIGKREDVEKAFNVGSSALVVLAGDIRALLDDDKQLGAYKETEKNSAELKKLQGQFKAAAPGAEQLLVLLEDMSKGDAERNQFDALVKSSQSTDLAVVKKAVADLTKLATDLKTKGQQEAQAMALLQTKLGKAVKEFNEAFSKANSILSDPADAARLYLKAQVAKQETYKESRNQKLLEEACKRVDEYKKKLKDTVEGTPRAALVSKVKKIEELIKKLEGKSLVKNLKTRTEVLKGRCKGVKELLDSGFDAGKIDVALKELEEDINTAANDAEIISAKQKFLKTKLKEIDEQLKTLSSKMKALKGTPEFGSADIPGKDLGQHKKDRDRIATLAVGEDTGKYLQAEGLVTELLSRLKTAIANPAVAVRAERTAIDNKKKADEALEQKKKQWEWDYNSFVNGPYKEAAGMSTDKKAMESIDGYKKECEDLAKKNDFDGARKRLELLKQLVDVRLNSPPGGLVSKNLKPLQDQWKKTVPKLQQEIKALQDEIVKQCTGKDNVKPADIDKLVKKLPEICAAFKPEVFDPFIDVLTDKNQTNVPARRTARERGLDKVREFQRKMTEDPLLKIANNNPFKQLRYSGVLWETLNRLDFSFQISL